jgi:multiple sugar transport system ATP-binding protein
MSNVKLLNVNKIYPNGVQAVFDFNLNIKDGEFMVFVGPSGCGKTTTLRMIAGLEDISSGSLLIDGVVSNSKSPKEREISMVFQSYALYPHMTVAQNIGFGLELRGYPVEEINEKVEATAKTLGLTEYLKKKPKVLSGGQRQRVALGRAIARNASVFLLDEPLSNLDAKLRVQMRSELIALHKQVKSTFIYVTHDQVEAMTMATRICVMNNGYIQQVGTPKEVYDLPENMFVASFMGTPPMNFIKVVVTKDGYFNFDNHRFKLPSSKVQIIKENNCFDIEVELGIRPEYISLSTADENNLTIKPTGVEMLGSETNLIFNIGDRKVIANLNIMKKFSKTDNVILNFGLENSHFFDCTTTKRYKLLKEEKIGYLKQAIENFSSYHSDKAMTYEDGLILITAFRYYNETKDELFKNFIIAYYDHAVLEDGSIRGFNLADYNIDNILSGSLLNEVYEYTKDEKYLKTIALLKSQLATHPRTDSGSFWHKLRYPYQIWLDGLYMGQFFHLKYDHDTKDSLHQFLNARKFLYNEEDKLYYHAYDETKTMQWADKITGRSPNVWSRSVGWWLMGLVDCYRFFDVEQKKQIASLFTETIEGVIPHLHSKYKMLFQIVNKPDLQGNYLETSGSAMLAYSLLKAYSLKIVGKEYVTLAKEIIKGIDTAYLKHNGINYLLGGICKVAGLDNDRRDGSDRYYLSEPVCINEVKGLAPYLMAYLELFKNEQ